MTVIWIAARSSQAVERWKDMPLPALTMEDADESDDQADLFNRLNPAKDELWRYLDGGDLTASAIDPSGSLVDIAPRMWARLTIRTNSLDDFQHADHTTLIVSGTNIVFTGVEFRSADVFKLWPPVSDPLHMLRQSLFESSTAEAIKPSTDAIREAPASIEDAIRHAGGFSQLTPTEEQIWRAILAAGGEAALPSRRQDRVKAVEQNANGSAPSPASIDRFFKKFKPSSVDE